MDPSVMIIIIGTVGGFLVGGGTGFLLGKRKNHLEQPESQPSASESSANRLSSSGPGRAITPTSIFPSENVYEDFQPLLSVWRHKEDNKLAFEIKGKLFQDRTPLSVSAIHKLEQIARDWLLWLGVNDVEHPAVAPSETVIHPSSGVVSELRKVIQSAPRTVPGSLELGEIKLKEFKTDQTHPVFKPNSIAEQIDIILQEKIAGSPLANRGIHIAENLNKEVFFKVGLKNFQSIEDIEELEVQHMIRSAVAEWDKFTKDMHRR